MYDLLTLGDLVADLVMPIPSLPVRAGEHQVAHDFFLEPGGMGNVLITAQRIGLRTAALGALGDDAYGAQVREALAGEGVDMGGVVVAEGKATSACVTLVDESGAHVFLAVRGEAHRSPLADDWQARLERSHAFYFNGYSLLYPMLVGHAQRLTATCAAARIPVFFDPGPLLQRVPREALDAAVRAADVVLLTTDEAQALAGVAEASEAARRILALGPRLVALKRGADGCTLATTGETVSLPGFAVAVKDLAGAGDAFDAAIVKQVLRGAPLAQMARYANAAGAGAVAKMGTGRRMPTAAEIEDILASGRSAGAGTLQPEHERAGGAP